MEKEYTFTETQLEDFVRTEICRRLERISETELFPYVGNISKRITKINESHEEITKILNDKSMKETKKDRNYFHSEFEICKRINFGKPIYAVRTWNAHSHVHELIRKLSLSVYGYTLNKNAIIQEYAELNEIYERFLELYMELYDERLKKHFN